MRGVAGGSHQDWGWDQPSWPSQVPPERERDQPCANTQASETFQGSASLQPGAGLDKGLS